MTANRCEMTTKRINTTAKMHKTTTERKITQVITERRERPQDINAKMHKMTTEKLREKRG